MSSHKLFLPDHPRRLGRPERSCLWELHGKNYGFRTLNKVVWHAKLQKEKSGRLTAFPALVKSQISQKSRKFSGPTALPLDGLGVLEVSGIFNSIWHMVIWNHNVGDFHPGTSPLFNWELVCGVYSTNWKGLTTIQAKSRDIWSVRKFFFAVTIALKNPKVFRAHFLWFSYKFMEQCWDEDPYARPSFGDAKRFFDGILEDDYYEC